MTSRVDPRPAPHRTPPVPMTAGASPRLSGDSGERVGLPTRQRRPGYAALALMLIVSFAAMGAWLYQQAGRKTAVVVVAKAVPAGHVVPREALTTVPVAGAVTAVAAPNLGTVVGQTAAVDLLPGMLVQRSMLSSGPVVERGMAQVGVALPPGRAPSDGLAAGDMVMVVRVPPDDATAQGQGSGKSATAVTVVLAGRARVFDARQDPGQAGGLVVTVTVPVDGARAVAAASSAGQVVLIRVGPA